MISVVAFTAFALTFVGFSTADQPPPRLDWPDRFYRSLEVFTFGLGDLSPNLAVEAARLLGFAVTSSAVVLSFAYLMSQRVGLRLAREGHIVVCGLGHKSLHVARSALERGEQVIVVELQPDGDLTSSCREAEQRRS